MTSAATALLRQLAATFEVRLSEERYTDSKSGLEMWKLTAVSRSGERWASRHEDHYSAARGLAELMGLDKKGE